MTGSFPISNQLEACWLDPLDANMPLAPWQDLAFAAVDPNPFFAPEFLQPYLRAFPPGRVRLAVVREISTGEWQFAAPIGRRRAGLVVPLNTIWTSYYAPLGTPLVRPGSELNALKLFLDLLGGRSGVLACPYLPKGSRMAQLAARLDEWSANWAVSEERAGHVAGEIGIDQLEEGYRGKRRKEMRRQLRRLEDHGPVSFRHLEGEEVIKGFDDFLTLEAKGWKGRAGTALSDTTEIEAFSRETIRLRSQGNGVRIDQLWAGEKLVAALVLFREGRQVFSWKIASDEAFSKFSPGAQIAVVAMKKNLELSDFDQADSLAIPGHSMIEPLWRGRIQLGTLLLSKGPVSTAVSSLASIDLQLESKVREKARSLRARH